MTSRIKNATRVMSAPSSFTGSCACGAVTYALGDSLQKASICHCKTCQAWSGGVFVYVESRNATVNNQEHLTVWKSSDRGERAFCKTCGSSMYCRITAPGPMEGVYHFGAGTLQDWKDIVLDKEIFIDRKPQGYAFHGDTKKMTADQMFALFAGK